STNHRRCKNCFADSVSSAVPAQWIKPHRCRAAGDPSRRRQRKGNARMRGENPARRVDVRKLLFNKPACCQQRLYGIPDGKKPSRLLTTGQKKQPSVLDGFDPARLPVTIRLQRNRGCCGRTRSKLVFNG